jgi:dUTPase
VFVVKPLVPANVIFELGNVIEFEDNKEFIVCVVIAPAKTILFQVTPAVFNVVDDLGNENRGGFGSTGSV